MVREMLITNPDLYKIENLFYQKDFQKRDFEDAYLDIRKKEGRIFSNDEVHQLPQIPKNHPLQKEWRIRKLRTNRLTDYISQRSERIILEVGCGNGWLAHNLARVAKAEVIGIDVNETELKQASSVFHAVPNLAFIQGDLFTVGMPFKFDFIIFASSFQYFPNAKQLLAFSLSLLTPTGEIHILDTPFYKFENVSEAKSRSSTYFTQHGAKMHDHYFHHTWEKLASFNPTILYNPDSTLSRLKNKIISDSPFPWIRIKKTGNG